MLQHESVRSSLSRPFGWEESDPMEPVNNGIVEVMGVVCLVFCEFRNERVKGIVTLHAPLVDLSQCEVKGRRRWDSNPRYVFSVHTLSKRAP